MSCELEKLQCTALRMIYGSKMSYSAALEKSGIPSLQARRSEAFGRFVIKIQKSQSFSSQWLKENNKGRSLQTLKNTKWLNRTLTGCGWDHWIKSLIFLIVSERQIYISMTRDVCLLIKINSLTLIPKLTVHPSGHTPWAAAFCCSESVTAPTV